MTWQGRWGAASGGAAMGRALAVGPGGRLALNSATYVGASGSAAGGKLGVWEMEWMLAAAAAVVMLGWWAVTLSH